MPNSKQGQSATAALPKSSAGWIVSPAFDLCFVINLWWIVVAILPEHSAGVTQQSSLAFWQVYFITTPHRWITLLLVATDPDKRLNRTSLFVGLAILAAIAVGAVRLSFGGFACLIVIEYVWNAWHFGAQHGGILRIYSLKSGGGNRWLELNTMRCFAPYVSVRLVAELNGWLELHPGVRQGVHILDLVMLAMPLGLLGSVLANWKTIAIPKLLYIANVYAMYAAMLLCLRSGAHSRLVMLTVANAAFHAVEYLAIVTFYAKKRKDQGTPSPFQRMAKNWVRALAIYVIAMGVISSVMENSQYTAVVQVFLAVNLWAAFMHYTYDGIIWKLRRPQTASTLGVSGTART